MSEPILVHTDAGYIDRLFTCWNTAKSAVQDVVTIYNGLGYGDLINAELGSLFVNTEELIFDKITGGSLSVSGTVIDKKKAIEIVQKPVGYNSLINAIKLVEAKAALKDGRRCSSVFSMGSDIDVSFTISSDIGNLFSIDEEGVVQFSERHQTRLDEMGKKWVTTDKGIAIYNFIQDIFAAYEERELDQHFGSSSNPFLTIVQEGIRSRNTYDNTFAVDPGLDYIG